MSKETQSVDDILNIQLIDVGTTVYKLIDVNEAKQAIDTLIQSTVNKALQEAEEYWRTYYGMVQSDYDKYIKHPEYQRKVLIDYHTNQLKALQNPHQKDKTDE